MKKIINTIKTQLSKVTPIGTIMVISGGFVVFALGMFIYNLITIGIHFQI